jgi:hypothetical protein
MAEGLQVFDSSGNKILDISDSLTKYLYIRVFTVFAHHKLS